MPPQGHLHPESWQTVMGAARAGPIRASTLVRAEACTASLLAKHLQSDPNMCYGYQVEAVSQVKRGDGDLDELRREQLDARLARRMKRKVADHTKVGTRVVAVQPVANEWLVR